jgi:hypothetical protein
MYRKALVSSLALVATLACLPSYAYQRAFVSSLGNDTNAGTGCILTAPCRSFQTAHGVVDAGGEIVALDAAGYAPVTITKSVTIIGNPGFVTGISVATGHGVTIATAGVNVVLRNLNINGVGGNQGVSMTSGSSLTLENCVVSNLITGVFVGASAKVRIVNSVFRGNTSGVDLVGIVSGDVLDSQFLGNSYVGLELERGVSGTSTVAVSNSVASGNGVGFMNYAYQGGTARMSLIRSTGANNDAHGFLNVTDASSTALMTVGSSMATGNQMGFRNNGAGATFQSFGNNIVRQNGEDTNGTITAVSGS